MKLKQSLLEPIINIVFGSLSLFVIILSTTRNLPFSTYVLFVLILFLAIYYFVIFKRYILDDNGILIIDKISHQKFTWNDIVSMSMVSNHYGFTRYEIRCNKKTVSFPPPINWKEFEEFVIKHANLTLESKSDFPLGFNSPRYKRWKKIGLNYETTSINDLLNGSLYINLNPRIKTLSTHIPIYIIVIIIGLFIVQVINNYFFN